MLSKKLLKDIFVNALAYGVVLLVLQIAVYPLLGLILSAEKYGTILLLMGIANLISGSIGSSLNNTRLILHEQYTKNGIIADYNIIVVFSAVITGIIAFGVTRFFNSLSILEILFFIFFIVLATLKTYYMVSFRLVLNFSGLLKCNLISAGGHLIGILIVHYFGSWPLAFFLGELAGLVYLVFSIDLLREPFKKSYLFSTVVKNMLFILGSGLIGNLIVYFDRFIIFPVLGADDVAAFTVASFFGKGLSLLVGPVSGVFLGYFSQPGFEMRVARFRNLTIISLCSIGAFALISILISEWITRFFYPTIFDSAQPYILIANLAAIVFVSTGILRPAVLKFASTKWQPIIQAVHALCYFGLGLIALHYYGLMGFCFAVLAANSINFAILYCIGKVSIVRRSLVEP